MIQQSTELKANMECMCYILTGKSFWGIQQVFLYSIQSILYQIQLKIYTKAEKEFLISAHFSVGTQF